MIDKLNGLIEAASGAVFGWRKLGVLIGILVASFTWLFIYTLKTDGAVIVPDLPVTFAALVVTLYGSFVVGNWGEHREARKQAEVEQAKP
jgi:hypothetical protein